VNSLLTSAVTLATEASNGTLNSSQDAAAQQEYQSILSEINNIGSTTTYNSQAVFGNATPTQVYTGDSSTAGASIDDLTFSALNSGSVGTVGGTISQTTSASAGKFFDLSAAGTTASLSDATTGTLSFSAVVGGATTTFTTSAATVGGLISQINASGIAGVSASFTTAGAVGDAGAPAATGTGIEINFGAGVTVTDTALVDTGTATTPAAAGFATAGTGIATITETGATPGQNLSGTDLTSAGTAETALTALNAAISDVASQRGYLGSQINTLNSISGVETTEEENLTSAETSISATNYGQATTAMSQEEVLSQTGISALAQANSSQQEVLKLLQ
jgi:flagellin